MENTDKATIALESAKSAHHRIDENKEEINNLKEKVNTVENTTIRLEVLLTKMNETIDKIATTIDKAKWVIITSICFPIIVAIVISFITKG
ncbi:hypothetical protein SH1V18_03220 [Vallitalea longa]|uniref:Uncharacterized protein n=1 Tax=Vallitalea longa TaxID=2936439 RepID=A0A9W6DDZ8_9FIRM|nr:hypothetical protein [Vallitalea longa]GKX27842.1 hypothetical protein SH1V18_03220 [Vallitalea longa]